MKQFTLTFIATLCLSLLVSIPSYGQIRGNGQIGKESRNHSNFTGIKVGGAFDVFLTQGNTYRVVIEADENLLPHIITKKEGNTLRIHTKGNIRKVNHLNVYVTLPELDHLDISGACDVQGKSTFTSRKLKLGLSGASDVNLDIDVEDFDCGLSGSSDLHLSGRAENMNIGVSGSGEIHGKELYGTRGNIGVSGSGTVHVHLSEAITASVSGSGDVYCYGNPSHTQFQTSGSGEVHVNEKSGSSKSSSSKSNSTKVY